jgi:hypothetical protein
VTVSHSTERAHCSLSGCSLSENVCQQSYVFGNCCYVLTCHFDGSS